MVFIEESNLKHILKTRQINQKTEEDIFRKPTDKTWKPKRTTILLKHLLKLQITKSIKKQHI